MTPTRDAPELRGLHLAQAIIRATEHFGVTQNRVAREVWREEVHRLCAEHFAEADRTIEQLVKNATDLAMVMPRRKLVFDPATGRISGEPAGVPGERR